jgi:hypothetical protein
MMTDSAFLFNRDRHEFRVNGVVKPSITQVLAAAGIVDFSFVEEDVRVHAMNRGKSVHWMLQLEDEGALNWRYVPLALRPYRKAYLTWKKNSGFIPSLIEKPLASALGFCGIPDRWGRFRNGSMCGAVIELKTGAVADWSRYQMAAQCVLIQPNLALARTIRRVGLSLLATGEYKVREFPMAEFDADIARFMEALRRMNGNGN